MKKDTTRWTGAMRAVLTVVLATALVLGTVYGTYAWFEYRSEMKAVSGVMTPNPYYLKGPKGKPSEPLYIPRIDIANETRKQELFFFSVIGKGQYRVQLGYTTNVPYEYSLYRLTPVASEGTLICDYGDEVLYFNYYKDEATNLLSAPLNRNAQGVANADDKYFENTYDPGDTVQMNARPLYRQTGKISNPSADEFTAYFVLVIDFSHVDASEYDEEVDVICIVAGE